MTSDSKFLADHTLHHFSTDAALDIKRITTGLQGAFAMSEKSRERLLFRTLLGLAYALIVETSLPQT